METNLSKLVDAIDLANTMSYRTACFDALLQYTLTTPPTNKPDEQRALRAYFESIMNILRQRSRGKEGRRAVASYQRMITHHADAYNPVVSSIAAVQWAVSRTKGIEKGSQKFAQWSRTFEPALRLPERNFA